MKKYLGFSILIAIISLLVIFPNAILYAASSDEAYDDGYSEGWFDGIENAEEDIEEGNRKSYSRARSSDDEIIEEYDLDHESSKYKNSFIDGYKDGFKDGYNEAYDAYDDDDKDDNGEGSAVNYPESIGFEMGEACGYKDYYDGESNDWDDALPSNSSIAGIFNLKDETKEYRADFIKAFKDAFKKGYEDGYRKAKFSPFEASNDQGSNDGEYFGGLLGDLYGKHDYFLGKSNNWERNLPSRGSVIKDFSLNNDSEEYLDAFLSSFHYTFEEKYNESYRSSNYMVNKITYENGYINGREIGLKRGEGFGQLDFLLSQLNNVARYKSYESEIINEFNLIIETGEYRDGFISGYNEGLTEGYIKSYQNLSYNNLITKLETKIIPISGGQISTLDNRINIVVEKGTYYNDVALSIDGLPESYNWYFPSNNKLLKASDVCTIKVANSSYKFDGSKLIELSFEYYGPQNGGIYKYINNSWVYLPSKVSEDRITTYIKPSTLNITNGIYGVFIDENAKYIKDIRGHWAKDEINTYARRGFTGLFADNTYKPDSTINRGQLLNLLSKVYNWDLNGLEENIKEIEKLNDYQSIGGYKKLVAYAVKNGYMNLYSDNTFKVYNPVTYNQLNNIMRKVTGVDNFNWQNTAYYMITNKDTRCKSYTSMDNNATRAEVIYMLYLINEWRY